MGFKGFMKKLIHGKYQVQNILTNWPEFQNIRSFGGAITLIMSLALGGLFGINAIREVRFPTVKLHTAVCMIP